MTKKSSERGKDKWTSVRIDAALMAPLDRLVKNVRDEFGEPVFRSKSHAVAEGLKEFLRKYSEERPAQTRRSKLASYVQKLLKGG